MNWPKMLRLAGSMALFAVLVAALFQNWALSWIITASLAVHELGHVIALRLLGVEAEVGFGPAGAWTRTSDLERRAMDHFTNSLVHLSGPAASLAYAFLALGLKVVVSSRVVDDHLLRLANLNVLLVLLNLLPMGSMTDGGKVIKRVFASLREDVEQQVVWALVPWLASLLWLIVVVRRDPVRAVSVLLVGVWFVVQVLVEKDKDDPAASKSLRAMRTSQSIGLLLGMITTLLAVIFGVVELPFWLTREEVYAMAGRWASLLIYLAWQSPAVVRVGLALAGLVALIGLGGRFVGWTPWSRRTRKRRE